VFEYKTALNLDQTPFFKLIYNSICLSKSIMWENGISEVVGQHAVTNEMTNIFKVLVEEGSKNIFTQNLIGKGIKNTLLKAHTIADAELDTLMNVISESSWQQIHAG
jgi:hypothetical protein